MTSSKNKKELIKESKKHFIFIFDIALIILVGIIAKSFFFYKEYFWYLFSFLILLIIIFISFLIWNKKFNLFTEKALVEDRKINQEILENKKDYFHLDFIIKIVSVVLILIFMGYLLFLQMNEKLIF